MLNDCCCVKVRPGSCKCKEWLGVDNDMGVEDKKQ